MKTTGIFGTGMLWAAFAATPASAYLVQNSPVFEQVLNENGCFSGDVPDNADNFVMRGHLTRRQFPGPPNYTSVEDGDAAETGYILAMPVSHCLDDEFSNPNRSFSHVQLYTNDEGTIAPLLEGAVGRMIHIRGRIFGAHTGHHHAPAVVEVRNLEIEPSPY